MADTLTIPNEGKIYFNGCETGKTTPENIRLALFVNDAVVSATSVVADFTQISTHGITTKDLASASWAAPTINGDQAVSAYPSQVFTATSADAGVTTNVYGYIAYSVTSSKLLWVVKYDTPRPITNENESITIIPENRHGQKA